MIHVASSALAGSVPRGWTSGGVGEGGDGAASLVPKSLHKEGE